jgi:hypothetical protein
MPQDYWESVEQEVSRLSRSLDVKDGAQALSDLQCLVECIAKIVLDIDGNPAASNASYETTVKSAHNLLAGQPGDQLANQRAFGQIATQASKIALNLGNIRNEYGGGHGRARLSILDDEMVTLSLDGGLLWARWALRRVGFFAIGRPELLIKDLVGPTSFYAGVLNESPRVCWGLGYLVPATAGTGFSR